ncbi:MAG: phasin family protein [Nitrososphaera sp.]|nr:phasin family protein [Nitrososphaera sp.]
MQTDLVKQWTDIGNKAMISIKEFTDINAKATQKLTQQQLDFMDCCLEAGVKQISLVTDSKGYKELFSGQASLASEYNEVLMDTLRKTTETLTETKDEFSAWFEKGCESFPVPLWKAPTPVKTGKAS